MPIPGDRVAACPTREDRWLLRWLPFRVVPTFPSQDELDAIEPPDGRPSRGGLLAELGTALQPARLVIGSRALRQAPRGDGRTTYVLPGWKAPEVSTLPIRRYLSYLGHEARNWGLGVNQGDVIGVRDAMIGRIERERTDDDPVNLVGWSLGGVVGREIARARPDLVHRVVTYGSPVIGGPAHTVGAVSYPETELERIRRLQRELDRASPIRRPITAIFTRQDTVVDWRACIDRTSPDVRMVEVGSTHVGLGIDPDVWLVAAQALAERPRGGLAEGVPGTV